MARVDDGKVRAIRLFASPPAFDVQLTRPVAALAADRIALEDRLLIMVDRALHQLGLIAVAEQALQRDLTREAQKVFFVARRQVPDPFARIPGDRRLHKEAIAI